MNLLINVGPDRHGHIPDAETELLADFGKWVSSISDAVHETTSGPLQPVDDKYGFCYKGNMIYVYLSDSFTVTSLALPSVNKGFKAKKACLLDDKQKVKTSQKGWHHHLAGSNPQPQD